MFSVLMCKRSFWVEVSISHLFLQLPLNVSSSDLMNKVRYAFTKKKEFHVFKVEGNPKPRDVTVHLLFVNTNYYQFHSFYTLLGCC